MSFQDGPFTIEFTLQHLAMVKICEKLFQQSNIAEEFAGIVLEDELMRDDDVFERLVPRNITYDITKDIRKYVITQKIDQLKLPTEVKNNLKYYIDTMAPRMFRWLKGRRQEMLNKGDPNWKDKIRHFACNISWDDFGCIHGRRTFLSYLKDKEEIDEATWDQLCFYGSKKYIFKFFPKTRYFRMGSKFSIYWNYKIRGVVPPKHMWSHELREEFDDDGDDDWMFDDEHITKTLLRAYWKKGYAPGYKYFWKQLRLEFMDGLPEERPSIDDWDRVGVFFIPMEEIEFDSEYRGLPVPKDERIIHERGHDDIDIDYYYDQMWEKTFENIKKERGKDKMNEYIYDNLCDAVRALWEKTCGNPFSPLTLPLAIFACWKILGLKDIQLCKMIFEGESQRRKYFLGKVGEYLRFSTLGDLDDDFWKQFMEEILVNDDERAFFRGVFQKSSLNEYLGSDCIQKSGWFKHLFDLTYDDVF